jgi:hypothetical protein
MLKNFSDFFKQPKIKLVTKLFLLVTALLDLTETGFELFHIELKIHHGIVLYCIVNIFESLSDIFESLESLEEKA